MQRIDITENGVMLTSLHCNVKHLKKCSVVDVKKRGEISGWSGKSRTRFRRALFEYSGMGYAYGVTCTLPFKITDIQWYSLVERFRVKLSRLGIAGFWRVELQQNENPHLHCVVWLTDIRQGFGIVNSWLDSLHLVGQWSEKYGCFLDGDFWPGADLYSCKVQLARNFSLWRYLCDHATKRKQCQMGWHGRQWGWFNKRLLRKNVTFGFDLSDLEFDRVLRSLRKLTHCRVSRGRGGKSVWFTDPSTIDKLVAFYKGYHALESPI